MVVVLTRSSTVWVSVQPPARMHAIMESHVPCGHDPPRHQPIQLMHQTWMKMNMRMINHLCGQHQGRTAKEKRDLDTDDEDLLPLVPPRLPPAAPVRKRKLPPVWQDPAATLDMRYQKTRASEQKIPQFCAEAQKVKPYVTFFSKLSDERQFEGPSSEALPHVYRTIQEEDDSLEHSWKYL